jgi:hypothetical protein
VSIAVRAQSGPSACFCHLPARYSMGMVADTTPEPTTLAEILTAAARRATDSQHLTMAIVGFTGALVLGLFFGRAGWLGAAASLALGAYGVWGMSDRRLNALWSEPGSPASAVNPLRFIRAISAIVATLAVVSVLGSVFVPMLGLWRS